jgi:hypothetical protein
MEFQLGEIVDIDVSVHYSNVLSENSRCRIWLYGIHGGYDGKINQIAWKIQANVRKTTGGKVR